MKASAAVRLAALIVCASLLLVSCAPDTEDFPVVVSAAQATDAAECRTVDFLMQFTFGEEKTTLLFAQGEYTVSEIAGGCVISGKMAQTVLGAALTVEFYYADGWYYYSIDGNKHKREWPFDELKSGFIFSDVFLPAREDITKMSRSTGGTGSIYTLEVGGDRTQELLTLLGEDIYALSQFSNPIKDRTTADGLKLGYTLSDADGRLASRYLEYSLSIYDTPPYVPGQEPDYEDYRLDLDITMRMNYKSYNGPAPVLPDLSGYSETTQ